jgi:hypothetical protein
MATHLYAVPRIEKQGRIRGFRLERKLANLFFQFSLGQICASDDLKANVR